MSYCDTELLQRKKKTKVKELKKRRHDSVSSFSDDDSYNSESSSSDYRRKSKKSKKRSRRDSSMSPYSGDDAHGNVRRSRKMSKSSRKRARKRYSSSDSDEDVRVRKTKRKRVAGDDVGKSKKRKGSSTKKSRKHLHSSSPDSLSCSTCPSKSSSSVDGESQKNKLILDQEAHTLMGGRGGDQSFSDGALLPVDNSRRLRSVIASAYQPDEDDDRWESNRSKEEIVNELDGYPSPISLDSNEINERDVVNHSPAISKEILVEHVADDHQARGAHTNSLEVKDTAASVPGLAGGDLESILRQKALENLKKFKVGRQTAPQNMTNIKTSNKNDVLSKSTIQDPDTHLMNQRTGLILEKDSSFTEVNKHPERKQAEAEPGMTKQTVTHPAYPFPGHIVEDHLTSSSSVSKSDVNPGTRASDVTIPSIVEPVSSSPSSPRSNSGKHTLEEQQNEAKDGPEFEQKTMSVMRGGEMVQVSCTL